MINKIFSFTFVYHFFLLVTFTKSVQIIKGVNQMCLFSLFMCQYIMLTDNLSSKQLPSWCEPNCQKMLDINLWPGSGLNISLRCWTIQINWAARGVDFRALTATSWLLFWICVIPILWGSRSKNITCLFHRKRNKKFYQTLQQVGPYLVLFTFETALLHVRDPMRVTNTGFCCWY